MTLFEKVIKSIRHIFTNQPKKIDKRHHRSKVKKSRPKSGNRKRIKIKPKKPAAKKAKKKQPVKKNKISRKAAVPKLAQQGKLVGEVTHFFSKISVIVIKVKDKVQVGDTIHIKGKSTNFKQRIDSLQIESVDVKAAKKGQLAGLKVKKKAHEGDRVFKLGT